MEKTAKEIYGNKVRVRACGLCWENDKLLLVNHYGLYNHDFWAPPGGGAEFGQSMAQNLEREFLEETGIAIQTGEFQFLYEFIFPPLHAIELYFHVVTRGESPITGIDPEMGSKPQIIHEVKFLSENEILKIPENHKHGMFRIAKSMEKIKGLRGYFKI